MSPTTTPQTARLQRPKRTPRSRGKAKARRALVFEQAEATEQRAAPPQSATSAEGIQQLPPLLAQVAQHGPLYERVSFHNNHHAADWLSGLRRPRCFVSPTRQAGKSHTPCLVAGRAITRSSPDMPQRISGRSYPLRRRAVSSVASFDASSTAARTAVSISASYYSPLATASADRSGQAEEDAEKQREGAVVGGNEDGREGVPTDSAVRVGLPLHSGHAAVGPARRSASDTIPASNGILTRFTTTVTEVVCTVDSCTHCCRCHLRHNKTGYGRCMRTERQAWPDCECAGKCPAGRCAQVECAGSIAITDLTRSQSSSHADDRSSAELVASRPSTPSSLPSGERREAGGVHVGEEVCAGPQASAHISQTAAYHQPSATVSDSRSAANVEVAAAECGTETAQSAISLGEGAQLGDAVRRSARAKVEGAQLPSQVLSHLRALPHTPHPLRVIADGRCSVASILLALRVIPDEHSSEDGRRIIDAERRRFGETLRDKWTEREWVQQVPVDLRGGARRTDAATGQVHRSYEVQQQLLMHAPAIEWLDHCVLYVASAEYDVGVLVLYTEGMGQWYCRHVGVNKSSHIVLYHACGHYEAVEYDGLRRFAADHELVVALLQYAATHAPQYPAEDDEDLAEMEAEGAGRKAGADTGARSEAAEAAPVIERARSATATPPTARQQRSKRTSSSRGKVTTRRTLGFDQAEAAAQLGAAPPQSVTDAGGIRQLPPLVAQVAQHGPLYERVSFHNHVQWRAANEPLWNAYRLASMTGQRGQLTAILLDILRLPQRVLPKLGRSGRAARRRAVAGTGRRLRSEAERLRERYNCPEPEQLRNNSGRQMSTETMASTDAVRPANSDRRRAASVGSSGDSYSQLAADTTDDAIRLGHESATSPRRPKARTATVTSEDERDDPFSSLRRPHRASRRSDPDSKAARRSGLSGARTAARRARRRRCCIRPHR